VVVFCGTHLLANKVKLAATFFSRFKGLMGKSQLEDGEGLLLTNCRSIHCFFMKMSIDAVYLSKDMTVLAVETLAPWSIGRQVKHTAHVLELAAGAAHVSVADKLELQE
jgi:uncharacterized membrane protein (UPF0127 family)